MHYLDHKAISAHLASMESGLISLGSQNFFFLAKPVLKVDMLGKAVCTLFSINISNKTPLQFMVRLLNDVFEAITSLIASRERDACS